MIEPLVGSRWARARWLVLAPHPDDETLGAGALIAHTAEAGRLGGIVFLTDGAGSHPAGTPRIAATRRTEAQHAVRRLTDAEAPIDWLGWRDAHPLATDSPAFLAAAARFAALLRRRRIDAVAVTDGTEAHCDHVAAYRLAEAAVRLARRPITLFAYHVWSVAPASARRVATPAMLSGKRRRALCAHRSQMSPSLGDGFRLPPDRMRMPARDILTLRSAAR